MTTVVCNREAMCADTFITGGTTSTAVRASKIFRFDGALYGFCGDARQAYRVREWIEGGSRGPLPWFDDLKLDEDLDILILRRTGIYIMDGHGVVIPIHDDIAGVGSGSHYALGALAAGASLERAVEIAAERDDMTKLPLELHQLRKRASSHG